MRMVALAAVRDNQDLATSSLAMYVYARVNGIRPLCPLSMDYGDLCMYLARGFGGDCMYMYYVCIYVYM